MDDRTIIYVALHEEGVDCWRPVKAEYLGADLYRIVEPVPEGEKWEFQPGEILRCKEHGFDTGTELVTFERVPHAPTAL